METSPFLPLTEGRVAGTRWSHRVHDLGVLRVPSGRLEASDPFVNLGESFVIRITPGDYPVRVTVADVSDEQNGTHLREAYLSVVLREGTAVRAEALTPEGRETAPEGEFYGVGVDAGTVGFADAHAVSRCMPTGDWYNQVFDTGRADSWFGLMDSDQHLIRIRQRRDAGRHGGRECRAVPLRVGGRLLPGRRHVRRRVPHAGGPHRPPGRRGLRAVRSVWCCRLKR